ncbi:MAG: hypothetical protein M1406_03855 [Nitrospirae bacterium]|nr:hypothetical protein [Nitrospirota bacterium]
MGDFKYKLQHLGDIVVGMLVKTTGSAKRCAQGVILTYDIHEIRRQRHYYLCEIGKRLAQVKKEGLTDAKKDDRLMELFSELEALEKKIEAYGEERDKMTRLCKSRMNPAGDAS